MIFEHLTEADIHSLDRSLINRQITKEMLPTGMFIGLDSMGPMRDSITDSLYPGTAESLNRFGRTIKDYGLTLIVATNGPDIEGQDILAALPPATSAFAVTEGGGKFLYINPRGQVDYQVLADPEELIGLKGLEEEAKKHPLMQALLEDTNPFPPIRTPYETNVVLTLPTRYEILKSRLMARRVDLEREIPGIEASNYVDRVLDFTSGHYQQLIANLGLQEHAATIVKKQNRRVYVTPMHTFDQVELNKHTGATLGSKELEMPKHNYMLGPYELENLVYRVENSIYIADKAVDKTGEGQEIIGASEKSMIIGSWTYFGEDSPNPNNINVTNITPIDFSRGTLYIADVTCRLAVNITMDDQSPRMNRIENVPVLHIGSGLKALEAISYFYQELHG